MKSTDLKIISASRRVEMVGFYQKKLTDYLQNRLPPENVHTVVFWSKNPENLIGDTQLGEAVQRYDQSILHYTITGMGGSDFEPNIPDTPASLKLLPELIRFLGSPERLILRFDPIVRIRLPDGRLYSNLPDLPYLLHRCRTFKIHKMKVSWLSLYPKVVHRLEKNNYFPEVPGTDEWEKEARWVLDQGKRFNVKITGCCVPQWPVSRCIDTEMYVELHPKKLNIPSEVSQGQRPGCGCNKSWDIGWYYSCPGGCLYCYANPASVIPKGNLPGIP